jgi:hypothetical protein
MIRTPIDLEGPYELAMSDITFSPRISIDMGTLSVPNPFYNENEPWFDRKRMINVPMRAMNGASSTDFFKQLNQDIVTHLRYEEYLFRYSLITSPSEEQVTLFTKMYADDGIQKRLVILVKASASAGFIVYRSSGDSDELDKLFIEQGGVLDRAASTYVFGSTINNIVNLMKDKNKISYFKCPSFLDGHEPADYMRYLKRNNSKTKFEDWVDEIIHKKVDEAVAAKLIPKFTYTTTLEVEYDENAKTVQISGLLANILGIDDIEKTSTLEMIPTLNLKSYAAVYCDLIEDQYVGDALGPIIRIINLVPTSEVETVTVYENPHYVKCRKSRIHKINIKILDLEGKAIQFENLYSFVIVKLHFRPISNE